MRPTIDENQADLSPADHQATGKVRFRAWRLSFRAAGSGAKQTDGWRWPVAERPLRGLRRPKADVQPLTAGSPPFGLGAQRSTDRNEPPAARPALALSTGNVEFPRSRRRAGDKMRLEGHAPSLRGPRSARRGSLRRYPDHAPAEMAGPRSRGSPARAPSLSIASRAGHRPPQSLRSAARPRLHPIRDAIPP